MAGGQDQGGGGLGGGGSYQGSPWLFPGAPGAAQPTGGTSVIGTASSTQSAFPNLPGDVGPSPLTPGTSAFPGGAAYAGQPAGQLYQPAGAGGGTASNAGGLPIQQLQQQYGPSLGLGGYQGSTGFAGK